MPWAIVGISETTGAWNARAARDVATSISFAHDDKEDDDEGNVNDDNENERKEMRENARAALGKV